jgi:hypothetical protein
VTKLVALFEGEGYVTALGEQYMLAAYAANNLGMEKEALEYAQKSKTHFEIAFGADSRHVKEIEDFVQDPAAHFSSMS